MVMDNMVICNFMKKVLKIFYYFADPDIIVFQMSARSGELTFQLGP